MKSLAQIAGDAGVSGIPQGPGSAGGLNNSVNDPSGIGNAARIQSHPAAKHGGSRGALYGSNGLQPPAAKVNAESNESEPAARDLIAPRISSLVCRCPYSFAGQTTRWKAEYL